MRRNANSTSAKTGAAAQQLRYAAYLRCSTDEQAEKEFSTIDVQRTLTSEYIRERGGVESGVFSDEGVSGTKAKRPGILQLLVAAKARAFDVVVVTFMSRLGRGDAYTIIEWQLLQFGVKVEIVREKFTDDLSGYTAKKVTQLFNGILSAQTSQMTMTKMEQQFREGYYVGGGIPFGCRTDFKEGATANRNGKTPRILIADDDSVPLVKAAYDVFLATRCVTDTMEYLRSATGTAWGYAKTTRLLTNPIYTGEATWGGLTRPNSATAMISPATFAAAQEILSDNDTERTRRRARKPSLSASEPHAYYLEAWSFAAAAVSLRTGSLTK